MLLLTIQVFWEVKLCNAAMQHCTQLFHGKMHSGWFKEIDILQGRWQHGEKVGYCYPSRLEKTLCKWDIQGVPGGM
jgi:hypothetical protein